MSTELPETDVVREIPESATHVRERFWSKVDVGDDDECWEWQRGTFKHGGYGAFQLKGAKRAHRIAYRMEVGPIPESMQINHTCDNRICVNPRHLYCGTQLDNVRDIVRRERHNCAHPPEKVLEIRERYEKEDITQEQLAEEYNTSQSVVSRITRRETYEYL